MFSFCPFCGQKLPQVPTAFVFCPFCGKSLAEEAAVFTAVPPVSEPVVPVIKTVEVKEKEECSAVKKRQVEICHLILKDCSSSDLLKLRLTGLLLRSPMAIQMAVDRLPSILLYKSRTSELPPLVAVFRETKSAIAVVDATTELQAVSLNEVMTEAGLQQDWISSLPENLWQGEASLELLARVVFEGEEALLVLGKSNLFVIDATSWKAKTLGFLEKVILQPDKRLRIDEWLLDFSTEEIAVKVYSRLKKDLIKARQRWSFVTKCDSCAAVSHSDFHDVAGKVSLCPDCSGTCRVNIFLEEE